MYWAKNDDDTFEVLDGQQRTISFCQYVNGEFSINNKFFHNLTDEEQNKILSYQLDINICIGTDRERLNWFERINKAGVPLSKQELLNINYTGTWLADAKKKFSKTNCVAYKLASKFVKGSPIRQEYLETALKWISKDNIADYMAKHQHDINANELWLYFSAVIEWVKATFGEKNYRKEMLGIDWGRLYDTYHTNSYDTNVLESKIKELMENEEVTEKRGVYEYVLSGCSESVAKRLSKRLFSKADIRTIYERQNGNCALCGKPHPIEEMVGDHIIAWFKGGKTIIDNLQVVCKPCNLGKGGKAERKEET
jgi:uncharacterized protein with ParB-like and HNH nuclease domain